jgi:hypothetical protein
MGEGYVCRRCIGDGEEETDRESAGQCIRCQIMTMHLVWVRPKRKPRRRRASRPVVRMPTGDRVMDRMTGADRSGLRAKADAR